MAISLKRYEPQVRVSAETGTQQISGAVASQMIAAAGSEFETLAKAAEGIQNVSSQYLALQEELKRKKEAAEKTLLNNEINGKIKVADTIYTKSRENNDDYSTWGTENDTPLSELQTAYDSILSDPRLQNYPELLAQQQINLQSAFEANRVTAEYDGLAKIQELAEQSINVQIDEAINQNDAEEVSRLINQAELDGVISNEVAAERRVEVPRLLDEAQITNLIASDPLKFIEQANEQIAGTAAYYGNVSLDYLRSQKNTARAAWNNNATFIAEDLWERTYEAIRTGKTSDLAQIRADAILADENDTIPTKEANDIIELTRNPYGESKSISLKEQSKLFNEVSTYDPTTDLDNSEYLRISNLINHISNPTIKTDLRKVLAESRNGELQGFAYNDIMEIIDGENTINPLTGQRIGLSEEETIFAKQEVVKYLRENPNDYDGALKLYKGISASKGDMQSKEYFRTTYGYSTPTTTATKLSDDDLLADTFIPEKD